MSMYCISFPHLYDCWLVLHLVEFVMTPTSVFCLLPTLVLLDDPIVPPAGFPLPRTVAVEKYQGR